MNSGTCPYTTSSTQPTFTRKAPGVFERSEIEARFIDPGPLMGTSFPLTELGLTNKDVRAHLATLERDGIVRQRGSVRRGSGGASLPTSAR
jgi:hypothetical protein